MDTKQRTPQQQAFLDELSNLWPLAKGSVAEVRKPCIRPNCRACREGRKHKALIFSFSRAGKRRCLYAPQELAEMLRKALANGRRLEQRLFELGAELIEAYRARRQAKSPKRSRKRS